jgi:hypothetical protein
MHTPFESLASISIALTIGATTTLALGQTRPAHIDGPEATHARGGEIIARPAAKSKSQAEPTSRRNPALPAHNVAALLSGRTFFDAPGDGSIWVRSENYKAGFSTEGACMIPYLGASAPANRPLRLSPESISISGMPVSFERSPAAVRAGDTISFDRAAFIEKYAVAPSSIEQSFVFAKLPSRGDLVLRLRVETDLDTRTATSEGLRFECERGGVSYGRATAVDALGKSTPIETVSEAGFIELRVPAAFVNSATLPLTIDPVISTFSIFIPNYEDDYLPDVAYDPSTDTYMVCMEQQFSVTDHDVIEELLDSSGVVQSLQYIDAGADNWQHPRIANNASASQFMVVAQFGNAPTRAIISRVASAGTNVLGNKVFVNVPNSAFDQVNPVIGGNPGTSPNNLYLVVWEFLVNSTGERDIVQLGMHTTGLPDSSAPTCIDCSPTTHDFNPAISKSCGASPGLYDVWNVVWESEFSPTDHDIWGVQQYNELGLTAPFPIDTGIYDDRHPTVSSFTEQADAPGNYLVAYDEDSGTDHDILGRVMNAGSSVAFASLSYLEGPNFLFQDQLSPSADSDGNTFAVAYSESYATSTTDYDIYISTFNLVGNTIDCTEPHQNLAYTGYPERDVRITASHGGPPLHYFATWTQATAVGNGDIYGGLYGSPLIVPYCQPGSNGVATCPCNNAPQGSGGCDNSVSTGGAVLFGGGTPLLSADSFVLGQQGELPSSLSIFLSGNANAMSGVIFGDGVRCAAGSLKRLYVHNASAGGVIAPVGADASVSVRSSALGDTIHACQTRFYQVYYRDANLGFCPGGFNIGSGLKVTWLP